MAVFLVEVYLSHVDVSVENSSRAHGAAKELSRQGNPVRLLGSIVVPADETCFYLYHADSADDAREAARRGELQVERISEAVLLDERGPWEPSAHRELWQRTVA